MIFKAIFLLLLISGNVAADGTTLADEKPDLSFNKNQDITNDGKYDTGPTGTELGNVTILDMKPERTTIPESDIEEALNLDYGRYTPMNFQYHNDQNIFITTKESDYCANQWIKCLISISNVMKICAVHDVYQAGHRGLTMYENYCDMYYDNCRNKWRYWRIVETMECFRNDGDKYMELWLPRRRINNIWDFFNPKNSV